MWGLSAIKLKMLSIFVGIAIVSVFNLASSSLAQDAKTLGVNIVTGSWNVKTHADRSFAELKKAQGSLHSFDYYYQLAIAPEYRLTFSNCNENPKLRDFLKRYVGVTKSSFLTIMSNIRHRSGQGVTELVAGLPIIIVGRGITDGKGAEGNGCFFDQALKTITPLIRRGSVAEEFDISFQVSTSNNVQANVVSRIKELFTAMNAAFSWTDITGERVTAYNTAASQLEKAFNDAGKVKNTNLSQVSLTVAGDRLSRLALSMPTIVNPSAGYFAIYIRLTGSQVLTPDSIVTPGNVLINNFLGVKTCAPVPGKKISDCPLDRKTFREYMRSKITKMPLRFFDLRNADKRKEVLDTCIRIRQEATEELGLSTIDALLVRWAAVKESGLYELLDPRKAKDSARIKSLNDLAKEIGSDSAEVVKECWNDDDQRKLGTVVKAVTGRELP